MPGTKLLAGAVALAVSSAACLPVREHTFNDDIVQSSFDVEGPRGAPKFDAKIDVSPASFNVTVEQVVTCERERREKVQRWRETKKTTNSFLHGALYALGVLAGAAGAGIIADNVNNDDPALRTFEIGATVEEGRDIGIAVAGGGAALLVLALGSSIRASDDRKLVGNVEREVAGSKKTIDCERTAAAAVHLGIVFAATDNQPIYVPLGMTNAQGRISVPWLQIVAMLPAKAKADGQLVAGPANAPGPAIANV